MNHDLGFCLLCGEKVIQNENGYKCSNPQCTLEIPLSLDGASITPEIVNQLLKGKKVGHLHFISALGKKYKASLGLSEAGRLHKVLG